jgi:hypothetical protein
MKLVKSGIVALLLLPLAALARTSGPPPCKPCGAWQLDAATSDSAGPALDAALARYKPPRQPRMRGNWGDVRSETEAEFQNSLNERPGPADRKRMHDDLLRLLNSPQELHLRQDGQDIVIEAVGGPTRRVTPGEPHSRVDMQGTAEIVSKLNGATLSITENYGGKTRNRETYVLDASKGRLLVTRSVSRRGLKDVVVHSTYLMR